MSEADSRGFELDNWTSIKDGGVISHQVVRDQIQFRFGPEDASGATLLLTPVAMEELLAQGMDALIEAHLNMVDDGAETADGPPEDELQST